MNNPTLLFKLMWRRAQSKNPIFDEFLRGKKILDVGCGQGEILELAGNLGMGIDLNEKVVSQLQSRGLNAQVGDAGALAFADNIFDAINCKNVIEHLSPVAARKMLMEMARVLKPGGKIILMTPTEYTVWNTFGHIKPYNPAAVGKLFRQQSLEAFEPITNLFMAQYTYFGKWSGPIGFLVSCLLCQVFPSLRGLYLMIITKK